MPNTKVPKHAKQVHKGVIFDVYQWKQKMYDGSNRIFEILKRQHSVLVIATIGNKIIIQRQKQPRMDWFYSVPSGRMDKPGESPKNAALRELLEETGMKPKRIRLWKVIKRSGKVIFNVYIFIANDCKKVAEPELDGGEKIKTQLVTFDQFIKFSDNPEFYEGELMMDMLRARLNPKLMKQLKKSIFG